MTASLARPLALPVWLAFIALLSPAPAMAGDSAAAPSAKGLWNAYPLHPHRPAGSPTATASAAPQPTQAPPARASAAGASGGGVPAPLLGLVALAALGGAGTLAWSRLRHRAEAGAAAVSAPQMGPLVPLLSGAPATVAATGPRPVRATAAAQRRPSGRGSAGRSRPTNRPPAAGLIPLPADPQRAWTAEIEWRHNNGESRFWVVADAVDGSGRAPVAQSPPLEWPPSGPTGVQALTDAAQALEDALLAAGWTSLPPGSAWYAKRFSWEPAPAAEPDQPAVSLREPEPERRTERPRRAAPAGAPREPTPRPAPARDAAGRPDAGGRFNRAVVDWPEDAEDMWRCELKWDAGYFSSRFQAIAYPPGGEPPRPIGASPTFKWMFMDDPDPRGPRYLAQVRGFASALEAAGWERIGRGPAWYAQRFVWRREGTPPDHVEPAVNEREEAT
jgi:hypothetical protein